MADYNNWLDKTAIDKNGDKIGTIADLYVEDDAQKPVWATVKSGLFGTKRHFVPLKGAHHTDDDVIQFDTTMDIIRDAPALDIQEEMTEDEERRLRRHYTEAMQHDDTEREMAGARTDTRRNSSDDHYDDAERYGEVRDDYRETADRSEADDMEPAEQPRTRSAESGREVRLQKYIVTETMQVEVPVQREVVRLAPKAAAKKSGGARRGRARTTDHTTTRH